MLWFILLVWLAVLAHVFLRLQSLVGPGRWGRLAMALLVLGAGIGYLPARILVHQRIFGSWVADLALLAASWMIGLLIVLWAWLVLIEIALIVVRLAWKKRLADVDRSTRRGLALATVVLTLGTCLWGHLVALSMPRLARLELSAPGLQPARYVMLADMHLGRNSSKKRWERILRQIRELEPDAVLVCGDLIDGRGPEIEAQVRMLRDMAGEAPVYMVTGNHERYSGGDRALQMLQRHMTGLLRQQVVVLPGGIRLGGIDDRHFTRPGMAAGKLAALPEFTGPALVMAHRPADSIHFGNRPRTLVLSGHTHAGQLFPFMLFSRMGNGGFRYGLYDIGEAQLYVTSGAGYWGPPIRIFTSPEIVLVEVKPGDRFGVTLQPR